MGQGAGIYLQVITEGYINHINFLDGNGYNGGAIYCLKSKYLEL
jgi:hypothetical protein